jgi:lipoyl(octanoyl) transferase
MIEWKTSSGLVPYKEALATMEQRVEAICAHVAPELVWLVEHPPLYTAGTSAKRSDLLDTKRFPVYETGRGGQYTYHGPGQRVVYVMIDIAKRDRDVRAFVSALEQWIIDTLFSLGIKGERRCNRVGIWVSHEGRDQKIAALGVRLRRWVSFHGIAINVNPILSHFDGIVPCGLSAYGVTSCQALGVTMSLSDLDEALCLHWESNEFLKGS